MSGPGKHGDKTRSAAFRHGTVLFHLAAALSLLAGCATPPPPPPPEPPPQVYRSVRPDNLPPDSTFHAGRPVLAADVNRSGPLLGPTRTGKPPAPKAVPPITPPSIPEGPVSPEWSLSLALGQRKASLNGVQLWLLEPVVSVKPKKKGGKPRISATDGDRRYTIGPLLYSTTNAYVSAKRPVRVFLDPGHGGEDSGTVSGKRQESALTLDIARRLASLLTRAGYEVKLSRRNDATRLTLEERPAMAEAWHADLFVSIHLNSGPAAANGIETYAIPPAGFLSTETATHATITAADRANAQKAELGNCHDADNIRLAWCVHRRLVAATGRADRGIRRARFTVLRESTVPAILVEAGFLSNSSEAAFLATPAGREKTAIGLCRGIMDFCAGHISPAFPAQPIAKPSPPPPPPSPPPAPQPPLPVPRP